MESAVDEDKKYPIKIVGIPKDCITIDDETYEFKAMVQHISQSIKSDDAYSAWFKKKNLTYTFQNNIINQYSRWKDYGCDLQKSGTPHLLFYKRKCN